MSKIALLLSPGFADWECAFIAGTGGPFYGLNVGFFATNPGKLTSQGGLECHVGQGMDELQQWDPDVLVVVGGMIWEQDAAPDIRHVLAKSLSNGKVVAGICGGTLAMARAGLLNDIEHTSNSAEFLKSAEGYNGQGSYRDSGRAIACGQVITSPGTAPVSFTAEVFRLAGLQSDIADDFRTMMAAEH
ncbi:MAG: DJ-1/PfpI family protein [Parasphingorhabdus sp.]|uniref:DJ-1/PfpI family protein n=1 Tax=Parasphingorhabdus sp. TaxID=2709688 RepID=UPI003297AAA8